MSKITVFHIYFFLLEIKTKSSRDVLKLNNFFYMALKAKYFFEWSFKSQIGFSAKRTPTFFYKDT